MASAGAALGQRQKYRGLRGWLDTGEKLGELERVSGGDWAVEMGAGYSVPRRARLRQRLSHALRAAFLDQAHRVDARPAARLRAQGRHRAALSRTHAGSD